MKKFLNACRQQVLLTLRAWTLILDPTIVARHAGDRGPPRVQHLGFVEFPLPKDVEARDLLAGQLGAIAEDHYGYMATCEEMECEKDFDSDENLAQAKAPEELAEALTGNETTARISATWALWVVGELERLALDLYELDQDEFGRDATLMLASNILTCLDADPDSRMSLAENRP